MAKMKQIYPIFDYFLINGSSSNQEIKKWPKNIRYTFFLVFFRQLACM